MSSTQKPTDSTDNKQPMPTAQNSGMTRRDLLRRSAVGGATLAGVSTGAIRLDHGPVQESEAIAPAVVAGAKLGAAGASIGVGWALRDWDPLGSDDTPEGLTPEAFNNEVRNAVQARKSNNESTFLDNLNIVDGIGHAAYADGKIAAIEQLNDQESQSDVTEAAQSAVDDYYTTVLTNFLKSWEESVSELQGFVETTEDIDDISVDELYEADDGTAHNNYPRDFQQTTYELPDGSEFEITQIKISSSERSSNSIHDPTNASGGRDYPWVTVRDLYGDGDIIEYLQYERWNDIYDEIINSNDEVRDDISLWVSTIYEEVQAGELDTSELLTPREQAELTAQDEDFPQAIADLQALNVPVDLEREAEIYISDVGATLYGQLAYTGNETLEVGEIDPDETYEDDDGDEVERYPGTIYFNYDVSQGQGEWEAYDDGIDGGTLTLTSEPFEEMIYYVDTAAGETAEFVTDDLSEDDDGDEWTIDLSDQLDDQITEVDQIEYYADTEETQYETIQLQDTFEIVRFTDSDGNEYEESSFDRSEPHSDDNYITEEEWQEQQERHEELIEQYEDAQGGVSIPGVDDVLDGEANGLIGIAVVGLVFVFGILSALNPLS